MSKRLIWKIKIVLGWILVTQAVCVLGAILAATQNTSVGFFTALMASELSVGLFIVSIGALVLVLNLRNYKRK